MPNNALLIANGDVPKKLLHRLAAQNFDLIIAADGGGEKALNLGITPDIIIGDLDSFPAKKIAATRSKFIHRPSQEMNDLEKSLIHCRENGIKNLTIIGLTGNRLDHTFNNFSVLIKYDLNFNLRIFDKDSEIIILRDKIEFSGEIGTTVSLIPLVRANEVTTKGLKYPLKNELLGFGLREGLSNEIVSNPVKINISDGILLLFILGKSND